MWQMGLSAVPYMSTLADYINSLAHSSYTKYKYTINSSKLFIVGISRDFIIKSDL